MAKHRPTVRTVKDEQCFVLSCNYQQKDIAKTIPGCKARWIMPKAGERNEFGGWQYPATPNSAKNIVDAFGQVDGDEAFCDMLARAPKPTNRDELRDDELPPVGSTKAWKHQRQGIHLISDNDAALLHWGMGAGKSLAFVYAVAINKPGCVLVFCPKAVITTWRRQFNLHAPGAAEVTLLEGTTDQKVKRFRAALGTDHDKPRVIVTNYESILSDILFAMMFKTKWDLIGCDEIHRIKSANGKISKRVGQLADKAKKRVGLTGTLMPHSPMDIYGSFRFLDKTIFGTSVTRFRAQYAIMGGWQNRQVLGWRNREDMNERMYRIMHRIKTEDVLELPAERHIDVPITLGKTTAKLYRELMDEHAAAIRGKIITASNALSLILRLQQITSGCIPAEDSDGRVTLERVGNEKEEALADIAEGIEPHEPIPVFCRFKSDLQSVRDVAESLGRNYMEISGSVNQYEEFRSSPEGMMLGIQIQSGSEGIDLTRAMYSVYYSVGHSLGQFQQSLKRVHRPGQTRPVTYYHLIAEGTVDRRIYNSFMQKREIVEGILDLLNDELAGAPATPENIGKAVHAWVAS